MKAGRTRAPAARRKRPSSLPTRALVKPQKAVAGAPPLTIRSGFVAVVGLPNVGKSTLINAFLSKAVCITSYRPQTTRYHLRCVATDARRQIVFVDTPGWVARHSPMDRMMRQEILRGSDGVDVVLYVVDATAPGLGPHKASWEGIVTKVKAKRILVVNKIDKLPRLQLLPILEAFHKAYEPDEIVPVSALDGKNLDELDRVVTAALPEGPALYDTNQLVDRPLEFVLAEFVREPLYSLTHHELPFATAVQVDSFKETPTKVSMSCTIVVEKESQKGIIIGAGGDMVKEIRNRARYRIQDHIGKNRKVDLEVTVKVLANWRSNEQILQELGKA